MTTKNEVENENDELDADLDIAPGESVDKNLAAAAAASQGGIPKNFRQQADMESFYRFVHENDLREDALNILDNVRAREATAKTTSKRTKH